MNDSSKSLLLPPSLTPLNTQAEDMVKEWQYWERSFERYCRMAKLTKEEEKKDVFWTYIGRELEEFLRNLPNFDTMSTVADLLETVKQRYTKTPNTVCERLNFRRVEILPGESVSEFNARLNGLSKHCDFDNYSRELAHLDQILLNSVPPLREKLLLEKNLTLKKALEIAKYAAEGSSWALQFKNNCPSEVQVKKEVNFNRSQKNKHKGYSVSEGSSKTTTKACYRCGSKTHLANDKKCPAAKIKCNICTKVGHFAKFCLTKRNDNTCNTENKVKQIKSKHFSDNDSDSESNVFNILTVAKAKVFATDSNINDHQYIELLVNNVPINFIIDTGSQATLIPSALLRKLNVKLKSASAILTDYHGNVIKTLGESKLTICKNSDKFMANAFLLMMEINLYWVKTGLLILKMSTGINYLLLIIVRVKMLM